jgi:hypothetical protein
MGWAVREAADWLQSQPKLGSGLCAANDPAILNLLTCHPTIILPRFRDAAQVRRFLERYRPETLILMVDERADASVGEVLLQAPWTAARVRSELAPRLETALVRRHRRRAATPSPRTGQQAPEQWLLVFRARRGIIE